MLKKSLFILFLFVLVLMNTFTARAFLPMSTEISLGEDSALKIENQYKVIKDERVTAIGNKLAQYSIRNGIEYKFKVLDT